MDISTSLAIVAFAAFIHTSFQLSVSVLTLLSGHALGSNKSHRRVMRLATSYTIGAGVMTLLILAFTALILQQIFGANPPLMAWVIACGLVLGIGIGVWLFYYRRGREGTELWIPRSFAKHLIKRSKATQDGAEAFGLGLTGVVSELVFIIPTIIISALVIVGLPSHWQLISLALYTVVSLFGLITVRALIGRGISLGSIQKWRSDNKRFLQFAAGSALIVLGFFVYVNKIMTAMIEVI